ncbi:NHL repeat-containing protein [Actinoplanes sp. RD1]|uniref:superoxide dismutase n=1 Tax=Actinoplanes sp. RD1 TaxID=3064538 RepID=UPI0027404C07|nr:superoxide dismutase [Actinoplanes sp. RD1]
MSRRTLAIVALTALAVTAAAPSASAASPTTKPTVLELPDGFQPEGIAIGTQPYAYFGSRADGDIYRVDLRTGRGRVLAEGPGTPSLGLKVDDRGRLFVSGGSGGDARVLDARTGKLLKSYALQTVPSFINDVVLTGGAAWYTDSTNPVLFKLPLGRHGKLPAAAVRVPLSGEIAYTTGNNANGITPTPDGRGLIVVQSNTGKLFKTTYGGVTTEIDLGGESVPNGDGLLLRGTTLYVVQNRLNVIAKIDLNKRATRGTVVSRTTDPAFDVPSTVAAYGNRLYLPNARFTTPPTPETDYTAVAVKRP